MYLHKVGATFETDPIGGWYYRIVETEHGVMIKRHPSTTNHPIWSHGTLTQIYQVDTKKFVPSVLSLKPQWLDTTQEALEVLEQLSLDAQ